MAEKPILFNTEMVKTILNGTKTQTRRLIKPVPLDMTYEDGSPARKPPFNAGDILWVRETYAKDAGRFLYRADYPPDQLFSINGYDNVRMAWRPSIHMPKEAARLFLKVNDVRVERLNDMTPEDCIADGGFTREAVNLLGVAPLFGALWDSTIKKSDIPRCGWFANPWVYVIEFEPQRR